MPNPTSHSETGLRPPAPPPVSLEDLLAGLHPVMVRCQLSFDRPTPLRPLATATARGLLGNALSAMNPAAVGSTFKPGHQNHLPPPFLLQPLHPREHTATTLEFNLVAWDAAGAAAAVLLAAFNRTQNHPFGESGSRIQSFEADPVSHLAFDAAELPADPARISLLTPLAIKHNKAWIGEHTLTLGHLVGAAARRLNQISLLHGNGGQLDIPALQAIASLQRESRRSLRWVSPRRRSTSQGENLSLSGIVGFLEFDILPPVIMQLLASLQVYHVGYHTVVGCGLIAIDPVPNPAREHPG